MKGSELRAIRRKLGMSKVEFATYIGYTGTAKNNEARVRRYENEQLLIPLYIARFVWLLEQIRCCRGAGPTSAFTVGKDAQVQWPYWPGYEFESKPDQP